jgi:hypothetical protein
MSKPLGIVLARDVLPARRFLLCVVPAVLAFATSGVALAQTAANAPAVKSSAIKTTGFAHHAPGHSAALAAGAQPTPATSASLRAANDSIGGAPAAEAPTGSIVGATVGRGRVPVVLPKGAAEPGPGSQRASTRGWYPESHSYLRPYHYKWRYWTPG